MIKDFLEIFFHVFLTQAVTDRPGRSTRTVDRTMGRSTLAVDRRAQTCARLAETSSVDRQGRHCLRALLSVCLGRPGRSTQTNREQSSQTRSTLTVDRACVCQTCTDLCTSVDLTGRPAHGAVDPYGRPTWPVSTNLGQKNWKKNILKILLSFLKITKNSFIILH